MKTQVVSSVALGVLLAGASGVMAQSGIILNFSSTGNVVFGGSADTFTFVPNGSQWDITSESGSANTGSAVGLLGGFSVGPFSYGPVTTSGMYESAPVTGPAGTLTIADGAGHDLTGSVNFIDVSTYGKVGGFINDNLMVNLSGLTYSGSNPDLIYLANNASPVLNLSFQFGSPGETLSELSTGAGGYTTSYSGSIAVTPVPEPSSLLMSGIGALGVLGLLIQRRK